MNICSYFLRPRADLRSGADLRSAADLRPGAGVAVAHVRSATSTITHTSEELRANVFALSTGLHQLGIGAADPVLLLCGSRVEALEAILALFNLDATAMPVSPLLGTDSILAIIRRMRPVCCLFEDPPPAAILDALSECRATLISLKDLPVSAPQGSIAYRDLIAVAPKEVGTTGYGDRHPALIIHSSGSSGVPKAVVLSSQALLTYFEYHDFFYSQYSEGPGTPAAQSPMLTGLPLSHLAGLASVLQGLLTGRSSWLMSFFLPEVFLKLVEQLRCSLVLLVPSLYRALLNEPYLKVMDRSALKFCITGGEPCPPELMERIEKAFGAQVITVYNMTECMSGISHTRRALASGRIARGSCGKQLLGELQLVDAAGNVDAHEGELWIRNGTVHECYLDPELLRSRLHNGWFKTRDLFRRSDDGDFFHVGRLDDMFICNGKNLYPVEIEQVLMRHPAVEAAFAAPVKHSAKGPVPAALVVRRGDVSDAELQAFAMKHGPSHAVPQFVLISTSVPQLGAGKPDRQAILRLLQEGYDAACRA